MARIRTIKPEFWKHEDLSELPPEAHMLAAALLNYADDEGYFKANPKLIKAECCPLREDSMSIHECLEALSNIGYIRLGEGSDGKRYGLIVTFAQHQTISRPRRSKIAELSITWDGSGNDHGALNDDSGPEGNREQGTGKGKDSDESSSETPSVPDCPHQKIIELYEEILPTLPQVRRDMWPGGESARALQARWREDANRQTLDWWRRFFERIGERCPFLLGHGEPNPKTGKVWCADLHWIVKRGNFTKILEGRYVEKGRENAA